MGRIRFHYQPDSTVSFIEIDASNYYILRHVLVLILIGRYSNRLYIAFTVFYTIGELLAMQIPFVGFQPVKTSEHMAAFGVFGLLQVNSPIGVPRTQQKKWVKNYGAGKNTIFTERKVFFVKQKN
jgi:hypothetical protein